MKKGEHVTDETKTKMKLAHIGHPEKKRKIKGVYQIKNLVTGDRYVGSSSDIYQRFRQHKCPSQIKKYPNLKLYQDIQKYGVENFGFYLLLVLDESLTREELECYEQVFIWLLKPSYNQNSSANLGLKYASPERKEHHRLKAMEYWDANKEKYNEEKRKKRNRLVEYCGITMTVWALTKRFYKKGILNAAKEAEKYLINP